MTIMNHCRPKGFLTFLVLWIVRNQKMTGTEIALELKRRRGKKPSPGTIYPVLKLMKENNLLSMDENKYYSLTKEGKKNLDAHLNALMTTFHDFDEMKSCCCKQKRDHMK